MTAAGKPRPWRDRTWLLVTGAFTLGVLLLIGVAALLVNILNRKIEAGAPTIQIVQVKDGETDAAVWGQNYPREYSRFLLTQQDTTPTAYGGSQPYDKLARYPAMKRLWNGYAFAVDFKEERGHFYSLVDQKTTQRQVVVKQPGACANCHSGDAPNLIKSMGWETFNRTPYADLANNLHSAITCNDCHDPGTMALRITRPAFVNAMAERGIDVAKATRQEMRSYVCGQCHVEYYFKGDSKILTFPWDKGLGIDAINAYYDEIGFKDWEHKDTGAPMLKVQHPEFELFSTSVHNQSGVACADCHMPYIREGAMKVSDHWIRSPLTNVANACQSCHKLDEARLTERVAIIQGRTATSLRQTETAIIAAIDAIVAARNAGASATDLVEAQDFHRKASLRWDFISSENSTGFHSPQESARVLGDAMNDARLAQLSAERVLMRLVGKPATDPLLLINKPAVIGSTQ